MRHLVLALLALSFLKASAFDPAALSIEQLKNGIENQHPAYFYYLAKKLFAAGQKDDAVFWFYAGQLRYRVYLAVNKDKLDPSGDPAERILVWRYPAASENHRRRHRLGPIP